MKAARIFLFFIAALACGQLFAEWKATGKVIQTDANGSQVDLILENGERIRVEAIGADAVRVRVAPSGTFSNRESGAVINRPLGIGGVFDTTSAVYLLTPSISAIIEKEPYRLTLFRADGSLIQTDLTPALVWDNSSGTVIARKWSRADERFYGLGQRAGPLNRRGRKIAMRNVDWAGSPPLAETSYISIPYYWGAQDERLYGVFLDGGATSFFQFDPQSVGEINMGSAGGELDYYVFAGSTPDRVAAQYGSLTGYSALPPRWSLGYHQSRYGYASQAEVLAIARVLREQKIPSDVLYFDIDYLDQLQLFSWNSTTFPDPSAMYAELKSMGFHSINIMEPVVSVYDRLYAYLAYADFYVKNPQGSALVNQIWYGWVSWLDFTKPAAAEWYKSTLMSFLSYGIDGVWNDLNEPAQNDMGDAVYDFAGESRSDTLARNLYALKESQISYDAMKSLRPRVRPWGISRSGFSGIQRYIANWGGDALSDWETYRANLQTSLSMALSGQNFFGHDIGGFLGAPDSELFTRWMEFSAFTPLFRNHAMNTSPSREPWSFGEPTLTHVREIINERYRLMPYFYTLAERAATTGQPTIAPLFYYFPGDMNTWNDDTEFMVGEFMLVAPVLEPGATSRSVYLPGNAMWFDSRTGKLFPAGQSYEVSAPIGSMPTFVRAGGIIPKGPLLQYADEKVRADVHLHIYPGPESSITLYEDDGISFDYQGGKYLRTRVSRSDFYTSSRCVIERVEGTMESAKDRNWYLEFHDVPDFALILASGQLLEPVESISKLESVPSGWTRGDDGHLIVKVPDQAASISVEVYRVNWAF